MIIVNFNGDRQKSTNVYIIALIIEYLEVMVWRDNIIFNKFGSDSGWRVHISLSLFVLYTFYFNPIEYMSIFCGPKVGWNSI